MLTIQKIREDERIPEITALLNRAYQPLAERGLNFTAATQSEYITAERMAGAHTFVALQDDQVAAVVTVHPDKDHLIYRQPNTLVVGPFAVDPNLQGQHIGSQLLQFAEDQQLASTYALDTAVPATHLSQYYKRRGYREVGHIKWDTKTYHSAVLAKSVRNVPYLIHPVRTQDYAGFDEVVQEVYREYGFTYDPEGYHRDLFDLDAFYPHGFWVATNENGKVLGGAGLKHDGSGFEVARMYVRPSARKLGIGSALMEILIREAQCLGAAKLNIWTDTAFGDAHRLYQKFGAKTVSERICPGDPDQACEHGMVLQIQECQIP